MPEGIEVLMNRLYLQRKIQGKEVTDITIEKGRYLKQTLLGFKDITQVLPLKVTKVCNKGKFMWMEFTDNTDTKWYMLNTFGMEARWHFIKDPNNNIRFTIKDKDKKYSLWFMDQRHHGTMKFTTDKTLLDTKLNALSPDFLQEDFTGKDLMDRIKKFIKVSKRREDMTIAKALMQYQEKGLGSGIGNYLLAEILYEARMSPHTTVGDLSKDQEKVNRLAHAIKYIMKLSYLTNNDGYMAHSITFAAKHRQRVKDGKAPEFHKDTKIGSEVFKFKVYQQKKDSNGYKVKTESLIKDRTMWWVPKLQK